LLPGQQGEPGCPQLEHTDVEEVPLHTRLLPRHTVVVPLVLEVAVV
jgi:hypothetical protein